MNMKLGFAAGPVNTMNRKDIPDKDKTITEDIDIEEALKVFCAIKVYFRGKESCPHNRGNWLIDFFTNHDKIIPAFCIKLPAQMKEKDVMAWVKPLSDKLKERNH